MSVPFTSAANYSFADFDNKHKQPTQPEKTHQEYEADLVHVVKCRFGYHANQHPFVCNTYSVEATKCINRLDSGDIKKEDRIQLVIPLNYPLSESGDRPTQQEIDTNNHFAPLFRDSYRSLIPNDAESFQKNSVGVRFAIAILADGTSTHYVDKIFISVSSLDDPKIVLVRSLLDQLC